MSRGNWDLVPLVEFDRPIVCEFEGQSVPALRDRNSGYVQLAPPPPERLTWYYENVYGKDNEAYYGIDYAYGGSGRYIANRVEEITNALGLVGPLKMFELGCAYGGAVAELNARGHRVNGSDINSSAVQAGREQKNNLDIFSAANLDALARAPQGLNVVYASHVLEHDANLVDTIRAALASLGETGLLIAFVPNSMYIRSLLEGVSGHPWFAYPDHLHMLSPGSIATLCDAVGAEPIEVSTGTSFEADGEYLSKHFSSRVEEQRTKAIWQMLLANAGVGMELTFVLGRAGSTFSEQVKHRIEATKQKIETSRIFEVRMRELLSAA